MASYPIRPSAFPISQEAARAVIHEYSQATQRLTAKVKALEGKELAQTREIEQLTAVSVESDALKAHNTELRAENSSLKGENEFLKEQNSNLNKRNESNSMFLTKAVGMNNLTAAKLSELASRDTIQVQRLEDLSHIIDSIEAQSNLYAKEFHELKDENRLLEEKNSSLIEKHHTEKTILHEAHRLNETLVAKFTTFAAKSKEQLDEIESLTRKLAMLETKEATRTKEFQEMKNQNSDLRASVEELTHELEGVEVKEVTVIKDLKDHNNRLRASIDKLTADLETLEAEAAAEVKELKDANVRLTTEAIQSCKTRVHERSQRNDRLGDVTAKHTAQVKEIDELKRENFRIKALDDQRKLGIQLLSNEAETLRELIRAMRGEITRLRDENEQLEDDNTALDWSG